MRVSRHSLREEFITLPTARLHICPVKLPDGFGTVAADDPVADPASIVVAVRGVSVERRIRIRKGQGWRDAGAVDRCGLEKDLEEAGECEEEWGTGRHCGRFEFCRYGKLGDPPLLFHAWVMTTHSTYSMVWRVSARIGATAATSLFLRVRGCTEVPGVLC